MTRFEHGYALLIGVGTTHDPKLALPATVADMLALRAVLTDADLCGYPDNADHLRLLCNADATRDNILDGLTWLKTQAERDPDATVIVYYSGHGGLLTDTHDYVLLPYETDRDDLAGSTLSAQAFTAALRAIPAKRLLTMLDCCHAEGMATAKDADFSDDFLSVGVSKGIIADLKQGEGRAVFTSSKGQQKSYLRADGRKSLYTHHLLEALHGAANKPGDDMVRLSHLMTHLSATVPESARQIGKEQTPFFDMATEDFPVALLRGGKGLSGVNAQKPAKKPSRRRANQTNINQHSRDHNIQIGHAEQVIINQDTSREPVTQAKDAALAQENIQALAPYLRRQFRESSPVNLGGIQRSCDKESASCLNLWEVYTALLTQRVEQHERQMTRPEFSPSDENRRESAVAILNACERLVLLGDAGSGKSTFVDFLVLCLTGELLDYDEANLKRLRTPLPDEEGKPGKILQPWKKAHGKLVPVKIILRNMVAKALPIPPQTTPADHFLAFVEQMLSENGLSACWPALRQNIEQGKALLLFDGLDEVPETDEFRSQVYEIIEDCARCFRACRILVTSRTYAYQRRLAKFTDTVLLPFEEGQIRWFARCWYAHVASLQGKSEQEAEQLARAMQDEIFADRRILDMARRPLLLTMIADLHEFRGSIPKNQIQLYSDATDLLLQRWERRKFRVDDQGKRLPAEPSLSEVLKLGTEGAVLLQKALIELAFQAHATESLAEKTLDTADIHEDDLVKRLKMIRPHEAINDRLLVRYLRDRAGILILRGGYYTFPHRSFQEYLSARYLHDAEGEARYPDNLVALIGRDHERWREVFFLAVQIANPSHNWRTVELLCPREPDHPNVEAQDAWGAWFAAHILHKQIGLGKIIAESDVTKKERVRRWLKVILTEGTAEPCQGSQPWQGCEPLPARERALAGNLLAVFGDDRPGVGLRADGLPDIDLIEIPAGEFWMGSDEYDNEKPRHRVTFREPFWMSRYPITNAQYQAFVADGGYQENTYWTETGGWEIKKKEGWNGMRQFQDQLFALPNHPVVDVSWYEAMAFCAWLTERFCTVETHGRASLHYRLPTEAEWEYAARGQGETYRRYPWGDEITPEYANYAETNLGATSAVGCFPRGRSAFGCEEMSGNVWEWCLDSWISGYENAPDTGEMRGNIGDKKTKVARVGSCFNLPRNLRSAFRDNYGPDFRSYATGFRVVVLSRAL